MVSTRRRFIATLVAGGAGALAGCAVPGESAPPIDCAPADHDWPMPGYDTARTSAVGARSLPDDGADVSRLFPNSRNGGGDVTAGGSMAAAPVVDHGVAYAAGIGVEARDVATGERRWAYDLDDNVDAGPVLGCGCVYVSSLNRTVALDRRDGTELWSVEVGSGPNDGGPVLHDGALYLPAGDVVALDAETGEELWTAETKLSATGLAVADRVYATTRDNDRGGLAWVGLATGESLGWVEAGRAFSPPAVGPTNVYVASKHGSLTAVSRTDGERAWRQSLDAETYAAPAVGGARVFTPAGNGRYARAFDAETGDQLWRFETGISHATPVVLGESVLVTSANDGCYLLDAESGDRQWCSGDLGVVDGQPVLADGRLFYVEGTTSEGYVLG